ncbi:MAG: ferritin-like domain-containing protein [Chloroflexota bacterium]
MSAASTANLLALATGRRALIKGAAGASLGLGAASLLAGVPLAAADQTTSPDSVKTIFSVARTAEQLAITFYTGGIKNASALGLTAEETDLLRAAVVEEQIHQFLFTAQGGDSLADTFSLPDGAKTFTDLATFIANQQLLEGAFDSAFIAAVLEFAQLGLPRVAQIACQIAMIESEHRALGREIAARHNITSLPNSFGVTDQGGLNSDGTIPTSPSDNWVFAPVLIGSVGDAPAVLKKVGYLGPNATYKYSPVIDAKGNDLLGLDLTRIYAKLMFTTPFAVTETAPAAASSGSSSGNGNAPAELMSPASGSLAGVSSGAYDMYQISNPTGSKVTLTLKYTPFNAAFGKGVGLEAYQNGSKLGSAVDSSGSGLVTISFTPASSGATLIKVGNYLDGMTITYTLTQS